MCDRIQHGIDRFFLDDSEADIYLYFIYFTKQIYVIYFICIYTYYTFIYFTYVYNLYIMQLEKLINSKCQNG